MIPAKDVYLDGRRMGCAGTWGEVAALLSRSGHRAIGTAILRYDTRVGVWGESPDSFFVRRARPEVAA